MLTKKHFKELARIISLIKEEEARIMLCFQIGMLCEKDNKQFDWDRWISACHCEVKDITARRFE